MASPTPTSAAPAVVMKQRGFFSNSGIASCFSPSKTVLPTPRVSQSPVSPPRLSDHPIVDTSASAHRRRRKIRDRVAQVLATTPRGGLADVKLAVASPDGFRVTIHVHRRVLASRSRFFAANLGRGEGFHEVEICDCDDVEAYVETVLLMYCQDLKARLMGVEVSRVLGFLKASAAISFDAGITSCLQYLEDAPWAEDDEENIVSCLRQLNLHGSVPQVLQRLSFEPYSTATRCETIFLTVLTGILQAKDDRARREMKAVISRMLREDASEHTKKLDVSKDTLYHLCYSCLSSLILRLSEATDREENRHGGGILMSKIAREADSMQWIVDILIDKKMADEFVILWANQKELASLHSKIPPMYRHEISKITAQLCIAIGRGNILVCKETRFSLLSTWLGALYEDFGWMRRACRSVDKKLVEDGLSQTIQTLPMSQQQKILLNWFDQFLSRGDDCPNIKSAFEVWWRRAFIKKYVVQA